MKKLFALVTITSLMFSCTQEETQIEVEKIPINISMELQSRANDVTYENGDEVGIYVVNYEGSTAGTLKSQENQVDNMRFTYNSSIWNPDESIFWKDKNTATDFYAYYPYSESTDISTQPFSVKTDQSTEENFWASNFLWGKASNVLPTPIAVPIKTNHSLSRILIDIKPGNGFTEENWNAATKSVKICDVKTSATIDLSSGIATVTGNNGEIVPFATTETGTTLSYKAMMIPQVVADNSKLIVVTVDGAEYVYRKGFTFKTNTQYKFTVTIKKSGSNVDVTIENLNEGTIEEESKSESTIPNNQIWYTASEKVLPNTTDGFGANILSNEWNETTGEGIITFDGDVTKFGYNVFSEQVSLTSITIPNGVKRIYPNSFFGCTNIKMVNISSIEAWCNIYFEPSIIANWPYSNPLYYAKNLYLNDELVTDLIIPSGVKKIPNNAFHGCTNIKSVVIGKDIEYIGGHAFAECSNLTNVIIPDTDHVIDLASNVFSQCPSLVNVTLGNSITKIPLYTFLNCSTIECITIPETITEIDKYAFAGCSNLTKIFCKPTTPPSIYYQSNPKKGSFPFNSEMIIYVPTGSYDDYIQYSTSNNSMGYIEQANWYQYESYIQPYDFN